MPRRRLALLAIAIVGGAALAAPLPVLELDAGAERRTLALDLAGTFSYEYRQSIYDVPVYEDFRHEPGRLRLLRVRSTNAAALEYFRWDAPVRRLDEQHLVVDAPDVLTPELVIRVARGAEQRIRTRPAYVVYLEGLPSQVVRVGPSWRPLFVWLRTWIAQID